MVWLTGCQCSGFLTCAQMLTHAVAHRECMNTVRESAQKVEVVCEKNPLPHQGIEPIASVLLRLAFGPDARPTVWTFKLFSLLRLVETESNKFCCCCFSHPSLESPFLCQANLLVVMD